MRRSVEAAVAAALKHGCGLAWSDLDQLCSMIQDLVMFAFFVRSIEGSDSNCGVAAISRYEFTKTKSLAFHCTLTG